MKTKTIAIEDATAAQVREFATNALNLDLDARCNKPTAIAKMEAAGWSGSHITVTDMSDAVPANPINTTTDETTGKRFDDRGREICRILIPVTDGPGGNEPVFGALNGSAFEVPRGKPVDVPVAYREILEHATGMQWGDMSRGLKHPRIVPTVPVTRLD